jgi:5'(3')-deoxyribonucleotidase
MKYLHELVSKSNEDLPEIYCDLDQVLVDLMKGADAAVGGSFITHDKDERWKIINQTKGFWENLDWMPGARRLYQFIKRYDTHILSAYAARDPNSQVGKMKWLKKNTKIDKAHINLVKRADKKKYATRDGKQCLLIDDYLKNIQEWETAGGIGIHHTNISKTLAELKRLGFK